MTPPIEATDEKSAARLLFELRWPDGWACPACGHRHATQLTSRPRVFECNACGRQCRVTAGTSLHGCRVPLVKVVAAAGLLARRGTISARQLARAIGVSNETAWSLGHRLRSGFLNQTQRLEGKVIFGGEGFWRRPERGQRRVGRPFTGFGVLRDRARRLAVLPGGYDPHSMRRFLDAHCDEERPVFGDLTLGTSLSRVGNRCHRGVSDRWMPFYACAIAGWYCEHVTGRDGGHVTLARALSATIRPFRLLRPKEPPEGPRGDHRFHGGWSELILDWEGTFHPQPP